MNLILTPELLAYVQSKVDCGDFKSAEDFVLAAIAMVRADELLQQQDVDDLRKAIAEGMQGESEEWDAEEIKAEGRRLLAERRQKAV